MAYRIAPFPTTVSDLQGYLQLRTILNAIFRIVVQLLTRFQLI